MRRTKQPEEACPEKRHRNVAHLWADKRVLRFFRKNFDATTYKNLRSVYIALCEIESDFGEHCEIHSFTKTVATYAGMSDETIRPYLRALQKAGIIDFWQANVDGVFGYSTLSLYKWEEEKEAEILEIMIRSLNHRLGKNPSTVKPVDGKTGSIKYTSNEVRTCKNPKGSKKEESDFLLERALPKEWMENIPFQEMVQNFTQHRREKGQKITPRASVLLANKLTKFPLPVALEALRQSIENSWTGVFPDQIANNGTEPKSRVTIGTGWTGRYDESRRRYYEQLEQQKQQQAGHA